MNFELDRSEYGLALNKTCVPYENVLEQSTGLAEGSVCSEYHTHLQGQRVRDDSLARRQHSKILIVANTIENGEDGQNWTNAVNREKLIVLF